MNPAILMMLLSNNYRGGIGSIDQPDHYFDDDVPSGEVDWFVWAVVAILILGMAFVMFITIKQ